ncbi:ABC transporter ATP-binding protein [Rhodovulum sulfidophilum]|uniref:Dipeptide ABC transporter ATP-binding protein n=1 Tax=Rhodovulum sulfidophilum TaxID=35806 RepID=A0ABS1RSP3_RHOSU|nr:dipeptide ABC transporter ATP-binding protein [Rhodovulum sulfidophilum]MBL3608557.1 dipeptide ABC transporter ATP-binding protein [Rhodovulum sulfidophilum]MCE8457029.1 dipeptide ABC transporter ATP-binding protein [Rhodovulum sulfidophilum]
MTEPLLVIDRLSIGFSSRKGDIPAVEAFSLSISAGEAVGLVGESGCGKSTVALGILRDLGPSGRITGGTIRFRGRDLGQLPAAELRRIRGNEIAMVYQEPTASLNPAMRIGRQLMEVPILHRRASRAEARALAEAMVADVGLPDPARILNAYPHQLSGGQQQRIVIAMALMSRPDLLILDEPTTALDVTVEAAIIDLIRGLGRKYGTALLFISHNLGLIGEVCDRICVMYSGEAVERGPVRQVFERMRHPYTQALFRSIPRPGSDKTTGRLETIPGSFLMPQDRPRGCNFAPRCAHAVAGLCDATEIAMRPVPDPTTRQSGHETRCLRFEEIDWQSRATRPANAPQGEVGPPVLTVTDLRKHYEVSSGGLFGPRRRALLRANESVSFEARTAETLAIVGESGCGKSTLARVLLGLETATAGKVLLDGHELQNTPVQKRKRRTVADLQMVFQNPFDTLNPAQRVGRQILRALEVFGIGKTGRARRERMFELLDLVGLPRDFADRMPRQLSGGQKQRVGIARAFAGNARIVVADEPVSALDVSVQAAVTDLLMEIQRAHRTTLIFISHDLSIVRYLADRVMVMYLGHVVEIGPASAVFAPPYHPYTEALLSAVPVPDTRVEKTRIVLEGELPSAMNPPPGCPFQTRCRWAQRVPGNLCSRELPPMVELGPGHSILCHLPPETLGEMEPVFRSAAE